MTSAAGSALTAEHYRHQLAIKAEAIRDAHALWAHWSPGNTASWKRMVALAIPLLEARYGLSAAVAARYFSHMALVETGQSASAPAAAGLPEGQIERSLASTGLVGTIAARSRGLSLPAAAQVGFVRFQGGFGRLAMLGGRDLLVAAVATSQRTLGWQRVTSGDPCAFCAEQEGEGISSEEVFPAHDNCSCTAEPIFGS